MGISPQRRIVVLDTDHLINAGVSSFLNSQENFEVIELETLDFDRLIEEISRLHPDFVILDGGSAMISVGALMSRLESLPGLCTVSVDIQRNRIQVCQRQHITIQKLEDFLAVFR